MADRRRLAHRTLFNEFWSPTSITVARRFFDKWFHCAVRSKLKPVVSAARTLQGHLLASWLIDHRIANALSESLNKPHPQLFAAFNALIPFALASFFSSEGLFGDSLRALAMR